MNHKKLLWLSWCATVLSYCCCFQAVSLASASSSKASSESDFAFEHEGDDTFVIGEDSDRGRQAPERLERCHIKDVSGLASIQSRSETRRVIQRHRKACLEADNRESRRQAVRDQQAARDDALGDQLARALEDLSFRRQDPHRLAPDEQDE